MIRKPESCKACPFQFVGVGFVPDWQAQHPKIAILLPIPAEDDVLYGEALASKGGRAWIWRLVEPLGYDKSDLLVAHVLRCRPKGKREEVYPTGRQAHTCEMACRANDARIQEFKPDIFIVSEYPGKAQKNPPLLRQIQRHLDRAFHFAEQGSHPMVLMGKEAVHLIAPEFVGTKQWMGHWFEGKWRK